MSKGNEPAYPGEHTDPRANVPIKAAGLTKRELLAGMAMQGYIARGNAYEAGKAAERSVELADALLSELERTA